MLTLGIEMYDTAAPRPSTRCLWTPTFLKKPCSQSQLPDIDPNNLAPALLNFFFNCLEALATSKLSGSQIVYHFW